MAGGKAKMTVKDHGFDALMKRAQDIARLGKARVKVGILSDSSKGGLHEVGPDGKASPLTVAEVAAILHFGTRDGTIPARPFLEMALNAKREELKATGAVLMAGVIFGKMDLNTALNIMGAFLAAAAKATVVAGVPPPNAPSVARAKQRRGSKGVSKPLIDTGRLIGAITWQIAKNGESE